jgi:hypothetical protein
MPEDAPRPAQAAIRTDLGAIFVSTELPRRDWLITSLSPGGGEKIQPTSALGLWFHERVRRYPGMSATVMIPSRERTALDHLAAPIVASFDYSSRQK